MESEKTRFSTITRRSKIECLHDMLCIAKQPRSPTTIQNLANLNRKANKHFLSVLIKVGYLETVKTKDCNERTPIKYQTTESGRKWADMLTDIYSIQLELDNYQGENDIENDNGRKDDSE